MTDRIEFKTLKKKPRVLQTLAAIGLASHRPSKTPIVPRKDRKVVRKPLITVYV